jgi:thioredoxin 1
MRMRIVFAAVLSIALFIGVACSHEEKKTPAGKNARAVGDTAQASSKTEKQGVKPLVTFVEIGSVRCIPCKKMQPIMKEIEQEYAGKVKVVFYDVWTPEGKPYGQKYGIRVIPTQVFLDKNGKEYFRHEGYFPKEELVKVLKQKGV